MGIRKIKARHILPVAIGGLLGYAYYYFMQSGGIKSLEDFKKSMGGTKYQYSAWIKGNRFLEKAHKAKQAVRSLFSR